MPLSQFNSNQTEAGPYPLRIICLVNHQDNLPLTSVCVCVCVCVPECKYVCMYVGIRRGTMPAIENSFHI